LAPWIRCVFQSAQHRANEALKQLGFAFLSYLEQGARSLSVFFTTASDLLQVTIAFVLKIFSFSDKKKVLDVFDQQCFPLILWLYIQFLHLLFFIVKFSYFQVFNNFYIFTLN